MKTLEDALYPATEPFDASHVDVGDGHRLYYEQHGQKDATPLVFLHGGPGGGFLPHSAGYFDPTRWRIVLFDQRGCGRSEPYASLEGNDTTHLVADIEALRVHLGIDRWAVAGGSWGSFLSLAYAQLHADRCLGLLIRGIFLGREIERRWWWSEGTRWLFPDRWEALRDFLPEAERGDMMSAYDRRLCDPDPAIHSPAAMAFGTYSAWTVQFRPDASFVERTAEAKKALTVARIFTHFCMNSFFVEEGALLRGVDHIRHLPALIVQGRYDVVTPARSAWDLSRAWPEAELTIVNDGNHSINEYDMAAALVAAQARLADRLGV